MRRAARYRVEARPVRWAAVAPSPVGEDFPWQDRRRVRWLVRRIAVEDGEWLARFLPWLRSEANMRSPPRWKR
jgi:hypothetical protein